MSPNQQLNQNQDYNKENTTDITYWTTVANTSKDVSNSLYAEVSRLNTRAYQFIAFLLTIIGIFVSGWGYIFYRIFDVPIILSPYNLLLVFILLIIGGISLVNAIEHAYNAIKIAGLAFGPDPVTLTESLNQNKHSTLLKDISKSYALSATINRTQALISRYHLDSILFNVTVSFPFLLLALMMFIDKTGIKNLEGLVISIIMIVVLWISIYTSKIYVFNRKSKDINMEIKYLKEKLKEISKEHPLTQKEITNLVEKIDISTLEKLKKIFRDAPEKIEDDPMDGQGVQIGTIIIGSAISDFRQAEEKTSNKKSQEKA